MAGREKKSVFVFKGCKGVRVGDVIILKWLPIPKIGWLYITLDAFH